MVFRTPIRPSISRRSALIFFWDLGVIYYPTKCKVIFAFDFGQSIFFEEFGYLGWMEMSAQCKIIDMTDFSPKAKRPALPKLSNIADLLACVDNLINLSIRVFKPEVVDEITRLKVFLHRNQNKIKERIQQSQAIVERLSDWTKDMLPQLRMGFEAGTSGMLNEYRTRLHFNASEYTRWDQEKGQARKCKGTNFTVPAYSQSHPAPRWEESMLPELDSQGLFGRRQYVFQRCVLPLCT
jgi:hypothetical protein